MSDSATKRKLVEAALSSAESNVALLRAVLADLDVQEHDALLSATEALARYGLGHEGIRAAAERGELAVQRGSRGKYLVLESELRRYIASRPLRPTPRRPQPAALDTWDADADRALRVVGGRR